MADLEEMSDDALVSLCLQRGSADERAFGELFRRHWHGVYGISRRLVEDAEDARDLVQETFFRAYRGLAGYSGGHPGRFRGWLFRIASNLAKNELRRRSRRPELADEALAPAAAGSDPTQAETLVEQERAAALTAALARLPTRHREILELTELRQLPYSEIVAVSGISLSAVKMRAMRARAALAAAFRELEARKQDR